jgi:hypothetical protein
MNHVHHWIIDTPNGRTSEARCSCGAVREMSNVFSQDVEGKWKRTMTVRKGRYAR